MIHRQQTGWIGIDIGSATVKVAQLARSGGKLRVIAHSIVPRSATEAPEETESEFESLYSASGEIGAAVALAKGLRGRRAALTMPMGVCDLHHVESQGEFDEDLDSIVRHAIESTTQASADHLQFDVWPAARHENSESRVRWNVLAVARPWSDQYYSDIACNKLACETIDGLPHSLARAVGLGNRSPLTVPIAALDWGFRQATLCIVHEGEPVYARVLKGCGLESIITALSSGLEIRSEEAYSLLQKHGLNGLSIHSSNELATLVTELIAEPFDQLEKELSRTLAYIAGLRRGIKPQQILVFGGGGLIQGLEKHLTRRIKIETRVWGLEPFQESDGSAKLENQCLYGPALALSALAWEEI